MKVGLVACAFCSAAWKLDQVSTTDQIQADLVDGGPACDCAMLAVDKAVALVVEAGAVEAVASSATSLNELIGRFKRGLIAAGIPKR